MAQMRLTRILKGQSDWPVNKAITVRVYDMGPAFSGSNRVTAGKRYIVLGTLATDSSGRKALGLDGCGLIPYTDQNLEAIRRGIASGPDNAISKFN